MSTPSDELRTLTVAELEEFGLRGQDPAWEEYLDAQMVKQYGPIRWPLIKRCIGPSGDIDGCVKKAYEQYPHK